MITTHVKEVASARGYKNAHQLAVAIGVADNAGVRLWNNGFARIDLPTLNKLCRVLKCQPGKLIRYTPDEDSGEAMPAPDQLESKRAAKSGKPSRKHGESVGR
jgi:DNA-binding Xre family transcriptional regulator